MRLEREEEKEIREKDKHLRRSEEVSQRALQPRQVAFSDKLLSATGSLIARFRFSAQDKPRLQLACGRLADALDRLSGSTLQQRWNGFEKRIWTKWKAGNSRPSTLWTWGARVLVPHAWSFRQLNGCMMYM
jgi:hypothetical protein